MTLLLKSVTFSVEEEEDTEAPFPLKKEKTTATVTFEFVPGGTNKTHISFQESVPDPPHVPKVDDIVQQAASGLRSRLVKMVSCLSQQYELDKSPDS